MHKFWRSAAEFLVACLALALLTIICGRLHCNLTTSGFLYVVVVVLVSRFGNFVSSIVTSIIAALCLAYLAPPGFSFRIDDPLDVVAVATFLIASVTISGLVSKVRKQAEHKLRDSEERLRLAVQAGRMYAFEWDMASDVIVRTGRCGDILDWMDDPTRDRGRQFVDRIHPDDRETYLSPKTRLTPESPNYRIDYRLLHPNGNVIWLEATGCVFFDGKGRRLRIIGLVVDVTERKQAEAALRETEARFKLVADTAPALIWMSGIDKLCTFFNKGWLDFTGRSIDLELGNGWTEGVHPEDSQGCFDTYIRAFEARQKFTMEYRLRRYDGEYRWVLDIGVPRFNQDGSFAGFIGSCMDITDLKLAEEALSGVNCRLIEAQEQERTRIARELHDDIGQRIALQTLNLESLKDAVPASATESRRRIGEIQDQISDLGTDIQGLSHRLHSSRLDDLGLEVAAAGFCKELSERQGVEIDFRCKNLPKRLSEEISLCLFRVMQEALQNAIKHSGSRHFDVSFGGGLNEVQLTVRDSGIGFDPEKAVGGAGLGLTSMKERLKLVDGKLSVNSQLLVGSTVDARVPLNPKIRSVGARD
ncbi:MAG TPA: PAS domain-containing protein [Candidatus Sulfotelmatobacter sp.]|jgi:PAS domain S-box-containing protein|nr:PAS domain-containing protein [Candidatus Sulfotelmatobacter sp.]